ncbi:hypothetical protein Tco_1279388 [Tanacetum coccineum]
MESEPTYPLLVGRGILATASAIIDCKKTKIAVGEGLTRSIFRVKELDFGDETMPYWTTIGKCEFYKPQTSEDGIARDDGVNPFKDVLVFRKMVEFLRAIPINLKENMWESESLVENNIDWNKPPNEGDGAWHIRIELTDLDGEKFDRTFNQSRQLGNYPQKRIQVISSTWIISMIPKK